MTMGKILDRSDGMSRRDFLRSSAMTIASGSAMAGAFVSFGPARAAGTKAMLVQYDWLLGNGQIGDIVAKAKGYFAEEGLDVTLGGGGPNAQTLPPLLAGQATAAQMTSSQTILAHGAGRPVMLFACGYQYTPTPISRSRPPRSARLRTLSARPSRSIPMGA